MKISVLAAATAALALTAVPAAAQRGSSITLFEAPNFEGASRTFTADVANLADHGFNDRAQSVQVVGRWRICQDSRLRGRCVEVSGDVPNLADLRLTAAVSSFEDLGRAPGFGGPGFVGPQFSGGERFSGGGQRLNPGPMLEGRSVAFFASPPAGVYRGAEDFCRRLGFSGVIYADDRGGLRDVLCRR